MIPYQFEIVTALTIISAGAILTVYLFLLKANGWIGKSFNDITLTLGSERPIQKINRMKNFPSLKRNRIVKPKPESSKNSLSDKKTSTLTSPPNEIVLEKTNSTPKITKNQIFPSNNFNKEYKVYEPVSSAIEPKENDISHTIKNRLSNKQEFINVEEEKPEGCQNFLGYLKERPKNTPIPEECFACTKLIDCPKTKKVTKSKENNNVQTTNHQSFIKQIDPKLEEEKPEGCQNFLGYLKERPKNTPIPEECFACTKLIDCPKTKK